MSSPKKRKLNNNIGLFETQIKSVIEHYDALVIEKLSSDNSSKTFFVLLRKNLKLTKIEKINPTNTKELIVSYYEDNKIQYDIISEKDILPINQYEITKERRNKINDILKSE